MSINPGLAEQELHAETFQRWRSRMSLRERATELLVGAGFAAALACIWWICPPGRFALAPALACVAVLALASRVRFDTPLGFTVATQLAFVPLMFVVPLALVPVAVAIALALARLVGARRSMISARALSLVVGNAWFAIGPAAVFALAHTAPRDAGPALLLAALAAQLLVDFAVSCLRHAMHRGASFASQLREAWVYGIDAALAPIGLLAAVGIHSRTAAALALVPLLGLLAVFARERHRRLQGLLELSSAYRGTALMISDVIEADDGYTAEHSKGVVALVLSVGEQLELSAEQQRNLEFAALLHDVGKIAISKQIINKPGQLDADEWTIVKTHPIEGQKMLDRVGGFMHEVGMIVRSHHERWDGTGYPDGLAGDAIPLEARIIAGCDTWNAMRTDRAYRKALSREAALTELLAAAGSQLDPRVVDTLARLVGSGQPAEAAVPASARQPQAAVPDNVASVLTAADPPHERGHRRRPRAIAAAIRRAADHERRSQIRPPLPGHQPASSAIGNDALEDVRASDPVGRLLEDSWASRSRRAGKRELIAEVGAAIVFLAVAVPLALPALSDGRVRPALALLLVGLYAVVSRAVKFPIGVGNVVPSYLVLVPMLLLLPPTAVPLLAAAGLVLGTIGRWAARRARPEELLFAIPDAWHALGPALVLALAGTVHGAATAGVYLVAFLAGCLLDLVRSTLRERLAFGIAAQLQVRVIAFVWLIDACIAPLGLLLANAARNDPAQLLLVLPLSGLLIVAARDRNARIAEAQRRLGVVARQRTRLQSAVQRLGDAFAAKLDLHALTDVVLDGSIDALDASAGRMVLDLPAAAAINKSAGARELVPLLERVGDTVRCTQEARQIEGDGGWALAVPFSLGPDSRGALAVARVGRAFGEDEQAVMLGLVERAQTAATEIVAHELLREQAQTDPLTRLGNRRKLADELGKRLVSTSTDAPILLLLFDLDGFKGYNDTFGHVAGDGLLARLGFKLNGAVAPDGSAYRLGGDEFCVILPTHQDLQRRVIAAACALEEHGETFAITASCGSVLLPYEATTADDALQLADKRMYTHKHSRRSGARDQAHDVLIHILRAKQNGLPDHSSGVAELAVRIGRRLAMDAEQIDELRRAAALHDIGKVGIPDAILTKPGPLDPTEWDLIRQHTILGERILSAAPALRPVGAVVRATHERWDGRGYPDHLCADQIPLAARVIAVCDAYDAIITDRRHRPASTPEQAREEIKREAGHQFDPAIVTALLQELDLPDIDASLTDAPRPPAQAETGHGQVAAEVVRHVRHLLEQRT
ncbi:MAG: HD domain-containing phosphohydrolase [Solirubrobacteraceae bacterium]